jgi:parvulin-like peptidyl-prolyl isomerase
MLPEPSLALPYPRAAWRLADASLLGSTVLWFSQIVIRHADARPEVSFSPAYWSSVSTPSRTRADALALAERVSAQAAEDPARFAALARQYSEDFSSRDEGGALGGIEAAQISLWPQVLDAVFALQPEQTSRVVETPYGFHVFYRSAAPLEENVSGAHIVIGHDDALWLWMSARGDRPPRTREAALTLANDIYRRSQSEPGRFAEFVQRYSEHRDAIAGGDFGSWSTRETSYFAPRMKRVRELAVGQVGAPIETHLGFEIIQRTPARLRPQYRAAVYEFPVASTSTSAAADAPRAADPAARAAALEKAEATAEQLRHDPSGFETLGANVVQWEEGRDFSSLTPVIAGLLPGQITPVPVDSEYGFLIAKRLEPQPLPPSAFDSELPTPTAGELGQFIASLPPRHSLPFLRTFANQIARELSLMSATASQLGVLHHLASLDDGTPREVRARLLGDLFERTKKLLGDGRYAHYHAALSRDSAALLLPADPEHGPLGL